jgi:hypothetical protein
MELESADSGEARTNGMGATRRGTWDVGHGLMGHGILCMYGTWAWFGLVWFVKGATLDLYLRMRCTALHCAGSHCNCNYIFREGRRTLTNSHQGATFVFFLKVKPWSLGFGGWTGTSARAYRD